MTNLTAATPIRPGAGDAAAEYDALWRGAGMADHSDAGRLRIAGDDALDLLNRLTTNDLRELPPGSARLTVLTNGDARVIDLLTLGAVQDHHFLALTSPGRAPAVREWLDTYTFTEDVHLTDRTEGTAQISLAGPEARAVLAAAGPSDSAGPVPETEGVRVVSVAGVPVVAWHTFAGGVDGFHLIMEAEEGDTVWAALSEAGAIPVSRETWEAFRVVNGMPAYGAEFGDFSNPLESRLRGFISDSKGCYTGQEVVARLITYKKVQKRLMAVSLTGPADPGAKLTAGETGAGALTSVARLPDGAHIGLALVRVRHATPGNELTVAGGDAVATLDEPAFARATEPAEE